MSDPQPPEPSTEKDADKAPRSLNLWVVYGMMLLALLVAIGLATMIVLPFYHRR
jgi:hypothetical protein